MSGWDKREVRRKEIESLVGKLAFMTACVRPGPLFHVKGARVPERAA